MDAVTIVGILEPRKIKSDTVSTVFPSISHEVMGQGRLKHEIPPLGPFLTYKNGNFIVVLSEEKEWVCLEGLSTFYLIHLFKTYLWRILVGAGVPKRH